MKISRMTMVLMLVILIHGFGCDKLNGIDEGDRNTFTWKGQLVKDCNGEPARNVPLSLEVSYVGLTVGSEKEIGSATTDNDGNFSITYKKVRKLSEGVALYIPGTQYSNSKLLNAPVNQDVYRDIAIEDCHTLVLHIVNNSGFDSAYFAVGKVYDTENTFIMKLPEVDSTYQFRILGLRLEDHETFYTIMRDNQIASSWNNEESDFLMGYGNNKMEVKRSLLSVYSDSIPMGTNQIAFKSKGFPKIDTIIVNL